MSTGLCMGAPLSGLKLTTVSFLLSRFRTSIGLKLL
jgi:hypothetical protein